ncbi:PREDICTED: uncharacterized protein LOC104609543 [Nelumbo nucifera]|uniref:Uncharacterized protein LOC104609543 n=1 Tax=Nelumbo nucifera TaxID=4432 RepID=A0A1U8B4A1_NELNU|nr:PREDICTED: uncharacterized protein LOC104609543 [Nelumbo nucifera]XP_010274187.1 PREDICTED: uncharacterized protein LOC104609543 [Nelumbo nucifera]
MYLRHQHKELGNGQSTDIADLGIIDPYDLDDSDEEIIEFFVAMEMMRYYETCSRKQPYYTSKISGHAYVMEILNDLEHPERCCKEFRMEPHVFRNFANLLRELGLMKNTTYITVEESLAIFLLTVGHNEQNRLIAERFQHSKSTISVHLRRTCKAICRLGKELIQPPSFDQPHPYIKRTEKYYPWFKDCIGAIDGTHVSAWVPQQQQIPYKGRKSKCTTNVMAACSFDMHFTFVYVGWEGSAHDSRVLSEAISRPDLQFPHPPTGKYYLVDSGYSNMIGYLTPYSGERYHLNEYCGPHRRFNSKKELFNFTHSCLRNVIERCFGVLKSKFLILGNMPSFDLKMQRYIVMACFITYNFIKKEAHHDVEFERWAREELVYEEEDEDEEDSESEEEEDDEVADLEMTNLRDRIADDMWACYQTYQERSHSMSSVKVCGEPSSPKDSLPDCPLNECG